MFTRQGVCRPIARPSKSRTSSSAQLQRPAQFALRTPGIDQRLLEWPLKASLVPCHPPVQEAEVSSRTQPLNDPESRLPVNERMPPFGQVWCRAILLHSSLELLQQHSRRTIPSHAFSSTREWIQLGCRLQTRIMGSLGALAFGRLCLLKTLCNNIKDAEIFCYCDSTIFQIRTEPTLHFKEAKVCVHIIEKTDLSSWSRRTEGF
ncbi:hypothetical protein BaRGS_00005663 [Batillaria attramentaria]|uniref:Uncharacterized protein n=1 Tax=Batillaria attramentaria TaxID=370345 RepID=A0ABD0LVQ1_9CAEN